MSWNNKVVWSEGMFLQPQHFQQHDRYLEKLLEGRTSPLLGHSWGFSTIELDNDALMLGKIQLTSARGIFPDGTPFNFPHQDGPPLPLEIDTDLQDEVIVLALPLRRAGTDEADAENSQDNELTRFSVEEAEVVDTNTNNDNNALLQVGQLRLKLMRKSDVTDAYTILSVALITERLTNNQLVLQKSFIPPMLHVGSDPVLAGYLKELCGLLHQRGEILAQRIAQPGRGGVAEIADFLLLQTINRHEPLFIHFMTTLMLHPERLFSLCLSLAGDLETFNNTNRRPPQYTEYQHDVLAQCFTPLMSDLRRTLSMVMEQSAISIELQDRKYGVRVAIIPDLSLLKSASFVLAVNAQLPADTLRSQFPAQVKIGPVERIRDLVNLALPGIPLNALPVAPRQIPFHVGFNYFELEKENEMWQLLENSGGLAIHIAGDFPGLELEFWAIRE